MKKEVEFETNENMQNENAQNENTLNNNNLDNNESQNENTLDNINLDNNESQNENTLDNNESKNVETLENEGEKNNKILKILKKRNIFLSIIAIICIAMYSMALAPKILQNDTFYTLKIGEYIYNNGISNLTEDIYSWHELPYTYPHWLYDLGMFVIYNIGGQTGIYWSTMIFSAILGISIYFLSNKKSRNSIISLVITIFAMYLIRDFIAARAQLVTFILFTWTVYFIEKFIETAKLKYGLYLILIPLLIANLHCAVFPFYFILFLPYICEYILVVLDDCCLDLRFFSFLLKIRRKISKKEDTIQKIRKENYTYLKIISKEKDKIKKEIKLDIYKENDNEIIFINNMDSNTLISKLSKYDIENLYIEEIPLEDLFMNYYK